MALDQFFTLGSTQIRSMLTQRQGERGLGTFRLDLTLEWHPQKHDGWLARAQAPFVGTLAVSFQNGPRQHIGPIQSAFPSSSHATRSTALHQRESSWPPTSTPTSSSASNRHARGVRSR